MLNSVVIKTYDLFFPSIFFKQHLFTSRRTQFGKVYTRYTVYIVGFMVPTKTAVFLPFQALCNAKVNCLCVSTLYLAVNGTKAQWGGKPIGGSLTEPTGQYVQKARALHWPTLCKNLRERKDVIMCQPERLYLGQLLLRAGSCILQWNATVGVTQTNL
jgi:hypothetical protein